LNEERFLNYHVRLMPERVSEISGASIVLLGSFNPKIFQPQWFARQQLIPQKQADEAEVKIIVPQISNFETEQITMLVTEDRFVVISKPNANPIPLRDLVQGTFFILEHTPVTAMGLNRHMHFPMQSAEAWNQVGDKLAPKDGWIGVLEGRPGMLSLSITAPRKEPECAQHNVKVEPSGQVSLGVYFETNEHYKAPETDPLRSLMKILNERWEEAQSYALRVAVHILEWTGTPK
jgi:hypothetical protein